MSYAFDLVIIGNGGHSKVVQSAIESSKQYSFDVVDSDKNFPSKKYHNTLMILAIGDNNTREKVYNKLKKSSLVIKAKSSVVDRQTNINEGTVILHNAVIQRDTTIGKHCIINTNASVDHDCNIGNFVHIAPNSTLCGNVTVGDNTLVGAGAVIIPGVTIGKNCIIGAGSVVLNDVKDNQTIVGKHG